MLAAGTGGAVDLHLVILGPDVHILAVVLDFGNDLNGGEGGLTAGVGVKGRHPDQPVDAVLPLQEAVGILTLNEDIRGFQARFVALLIVQNLIGEAVALRPAGVHPVEHLGPVLGLGAAGAGVELQNGIGVVLIIVAGEQGLQAAGLHVFRQLLVAVL